MSLLMLLFLILHQPVDLSYVRDAFHKSLTNDDACKSLNTYFKANAPNDAITAAYKAANVAMHAQFVSGHYDKWKAIKESQAGFEMAVASRPNDVEIRYLRCLIELNLPSFLPIDKHVDEDVAMVTKDLKSLRDALGPARFETARKFLLDEAPLTKSQRQVLQQWKG